MLKNIRAKFFRSGRVISHAAIVFMSCCSLTCVLVNTPKAVKSKIDSKVLGQEREFTIFLPKNYDANSVKTYPVVYMLDWSETIVDKFASVSENGHVPETILVGIRIIGETRDMDLLPPYMKSDLEKDNSPMGRGDKFLKFMKTELMPYINANYKVSGVNAFSGHSRGGVLVIYSLLASPDMFQARFAFSPAVWREDKLLVGATSKFLASKSETKSFFYTSLGEDEDDIMKEGFNALTDALRKSPHQNLIWYSEYTKDANHGTNLEFSISRGLEKWGEYVKNEGQLATP